jgi:hypothetical protein
LASDPCNRGAALYTDVAGKPGATLAFDIGAPPDVTGRTSQQHKGQWIVTTLLVEPLPAPAPRRELRWAYTRGAERRLVNLSLDSDGRTCEFQVRHDEMRSRVKVERYAHATEAIERQCEYEEHLLAVGFSLESFEPITDRY